VIRTALSDAVRATTSVTATEGWPCHWMVTHSKRMRRSNFANLRDHRQSFCRPHCHPGSARPRGRPSSGGDLQLDAALVSAIDLHPGRLADDREIGPHLWIGFHEALGARPSHHSSMFARRVDGVAVEQIGSGPRQNLQRAAYFLPSPKLLWSVWFWNEPKGYAGWVGDSPLDFSGSNSILP